MALPTYDTLDGIPEPFRELYAEKDGKWLPKPPADELGEKGKETLRKEREARDREKVRAEAAEHERDELKRVADAAEKGVTREALDKINSDAEKKFAADLKERDDLKAENRKLKLDDKVRKLALDSGAMPGRLDKMMKDLKDRLDLGHDGGIIVHGVDGAATAETIDDFLKTTYKKEAPFFYAGPGGSGSGADASEGGGGSGYDPVAAGKAAAAAQKKTGKENELAFR